MNNLEVNVNCGWLQSDFGPDTNIWNPFPELKIIFQKNNGGLWLYNGSAIAEEFSCLRLREPGDENGNNYSYDRINIKDSSIIFTGNSPCGEFKIEMNAADNGTIKVNASLIFSRAWRGGVDFCLLKRPVEFMRCRFYDMLVSGWSNENSGIVFTPLFEGASRLTINHSDAGSVQCMGLSCPAGISMGERDFAAGEVIAGAMSIAVGAYDLWSPEIAGHPETHEVSPLPAKSYDKYIELWHSFTRQPGLWIDLDSDSKMGMFHRGWYGFLSGNKKISGALVFSPETKKYKETLDEPMIELAWGGSANVVIMETMFRLGDSRASKILNALLYFKNGGFMHENGSWINGYQPAANKFSDRYGRAHSETATGGVVNMMLWRCLKRGYVPELERKVFIQRLETFCGTFLVSMMSEKSGGIAFSRYWDGMPGQNRSFDTYPDECYPVSDAFAAFSFMIAYILTGKNDYKQKFERMLQHLLLHLRRNEWRFMEYDTLGADAVAPSWILLVLDEILEHKDLAGKKLTEEVWEQYHRTYCVIHSFLRLREDYPDAEWKAAEKWGGKTITVGGIIHGSTPGSMQGAHSVHLRYDFPLALVAYVRRTGSAVAAADLESYLNWSTWLQYTDPRWPDIIGASTEHITFRQGYVQDTVQIKHGNPIAMLEWLEYNDAKSK
ncbi:MAG: hypothetical protein ACYC4Q_05920 [Victivallaceae bacterium]